MKQLRDILTAGLILPICLNAFAEDAPNPLTGIDPNQASDRAFKEGDLALSKWPKTDRADHPRRRPAPSPSLHVTPMREADTDTPSPKRR